MQKSTKFLLGPNPLYWESEDTSLANWDGLKLGCKLEVNPNSSSFLDMNGDVRIKNAWLFSEEDPNMKVEATQNAPYKFVGKEITKVEDLPINLPWEGEVQAKEDLPENSGGSCNYYKVPIEKPTTALDPYIAECNDVIEALNMTYAEANMFKEIWRSAAARTLGKLKAGHNELRGAEKVVFFADRNLIQKS